MLLLGEEAEKQGRRLCRPRTEIMPALLLPLLLSDGDAVRVRSFARDWAGREEMECWEKWGKNGFPTNRECHEGEDELKTGKHILGDCRP